MAKAWVVFCLFAGAHALRIALASGTNGFNASATDLAGNVGTGALTVTQDASAVNINLVEGTHFHVVYQQTITVPASPSVLSFTYDNLNFDIAGVPEPASILLFTSGLAGLGLLRRRRATLRRP